MDEVFALSKDRFNTDLTTFFPFDPYKLPRSSMFIDGIYREWSSVAIDDDDDDSDEDGEDGEDYEGDDEDVSAKAYQNGWAYDLPPSSSQPISDDDGKVNDDETGVLGASFGGMSISPAAPIIR